MLLSLAAVVGLSATAVAQRMPERSLVRKGNRQFARERYDLSADSYKQALESAPGNFEATYNLGNTMVRTEQYDKAEQLLTAAAADSLRSDEERAEAFTIWAMPSLRRRSSRRLWRATATLWN